MACWISKGPRLVAVVGDLPTAQKLLPHGVEWTLTDMSVVTAVLRAIERGRSISLESVRPVEGPRI